MKEIDFRYDLLPLKDTLFRLAKRITGSREDAEDLVQDTLLRLWQQRSELGEKTSLEAYAITICRNLALDRLRASERRNVSLDEESYAAPDNAPSPQQQLESRERHARLERLFASLPEPARSVLHLRDIEGKSTRETAEALNLSEGNVKVILSRARTALRNQLLKTHHDGL